MTRFRKGGRRASGATIAARALQRAASQDEPSLTSLLERVPSILAEAESRRRRESVSGAAAGVFRAGRAWLPRLAAVTALLVLAAIVLPGRTSRARATHAHGPATTAASAAPSGPSGAGSDDSSLESWLVTGSSASPVSDPVLDALVR